MTYSPDDLDTMVRQYVATLLWSETDDGQEPLDDTYDADDMAPEALTSIREDCAGFVDLAAVQLEGMDPGQAGHDFLLTRNGHGAGFWDRGLGERGDVLTKWAHTFGETNAYVGDDGKVYVS